MARLVITGANRGIGLELTKRYAAAGHAVVACCRAPAQAEVLAELAAGPADVRVQALDVADADSVAALGAALADETVDVLINNAGISGPARAHQSLWDMDYDGWAETFAVNAMGPLRVLQALHAPLKRAALGKAVTITSQLGALSLQFPTSYAYCSSKAAVNKVMRLASLELEKGGIAVSLIHPGWVKTDMGGAGADLTVDESAAGIMDVIDALTLETTGRFLKWNGEPHDW
ncbi:MAG: SDR family oxidoreductase [Pseudomonadales bacterium]|jgi:NAD(P)-dependent dehydrogenase (short-subunit alcohol dehydrogenase family)|nr:SDR family oxidoreductase [Pseudomonadales bacterium]